MALPVERLNDRFEGEFRFRGRNYGVPFTLPGDHVQFQMERRGRRRNSLKVVKIEPAESYPPEILLSEPFCAVHGRCGGCRAQHLAYDYQLTLKSGPVRQRMREKFDLDPTLLPAPRLRGFRGRMDFAVDGEAVGLRPAGDFASFVDIDECPVQSQAAGECLAIFRNRLNEQRELAFRRADESGIIQYITLRSGPASGIAILTVVDERAADPTYLGFRDQLADALPGGFSLVEALSPLQADLSNPPGGKTIKGDDYFTTRLAGRDFRVPYDAFFQPNPVAFDVLLDWSFQALEKRLAASPPTGSALIDLYSGMGVLSSLTVDRFPGIFDAVRGYDFTPSAVARAPELFPEELAVHFEARDLNRPGEDLFAGEIAPGLLLIDPPRAGLSPKLAQRIAAEKPAPLILYISCNPKTQLRDLEDHLAAGYRPLEACIVDCFPYTPHLEQAVLLERRES